MLRLFQSPLCAHRFPSIKCYMYPFTTTTSDRDLQVDSPSTLWCSSYTWAPGAGQQPRRAMSSLPQVLPIPGRQTVAYSLPSPRTIFPVFLLPVIVPPFPRATSLRPMPSLPCTTTTR